VNLARALYFNADNILMDDPLRSARQMTERTTTGASDSAGGRLLRALRKRVLMLCSFFVFLCAHISAVDAHVSKYLFQECIQGAMQGKTRVLVTHQLQYLPQADFIVFLKDGRVHESGTLAALMATPASEVAALFREHGGGDNSAGAEEQSTDDPAVDPAVAAAAARVTHRASTEKQQETAEDEAEAAKASKVPVAPVSGAPRTLITVEERASGGLGLGVWRFYMRAFGGWRWCIFILLSVIVQMATRLYNDLWLAGWTDDQYDKPMSFYMSVYSALGVATCMASAWNISLFVLRGTSAAIEIHDRSLFSLMRAPTSFFDTTPVGRVLNRFSRDQDVIDNSLSDSLRMLTFLFSAIVGVLVLMCYVQPYFTVALVPILSERTAPMSAQQHA
jgi:hypothetical protein